MRALLLQKGGSTPANQSHSEHASCIPLNSFQLVASILAAEIVFSDAADFYLTNAS
jgi:hypothetical protein